MTENHKMDTFSNFYKRVSLLISDQLSSMLSINFDMKSLETQETR